MMKRTIIVLVATIAIIVGLVGLDAAGLAWYAPWRANKVTDVTRNTNQYVTTQQEAIADAVRRYTDPNASDGQKAASIDDMCRAANRIDDEYVPEMAKAPMRQRGCWNAR